MCVTRQLDGSPSTFGSERILQRQFKYQLEIVTYVYLGFGMQVCPAGSPIKSLLKLPGCLHCDGLVVGCKLHASEAVEWDVLENHTGMRAGIRWPIVWLLAFSPPLLFLRTMLILANP